MLTEVPKKDLACPHCGLQQTRCWPHELGNPCNRCGKLMDELPEQTEIHIEFGNSVGLYFTQWRFDELASLAKELAEAVPQATGWRIWYDACGDFHRLEFDLEGHHYGVAYYKVFTVTRDGNENYGGDFAKKNYGRSTWNLVSLFRSGRYKTWADAG